MSESTAEPTDAKPADAGQVDAALDKVQSDVNAVAAAAGGEGAGGHPAPAAPAKGSPAAAAEGSQTAVAGEPNPAPTAELPGEAEALGDLTDDSADTSAGDLPAEIRRLMVIEVPVIVQLGGRRMTVAEVMRFSVGAIIEISKGAEDELDLLASNRPIGKGHAVKVGENFGIKLTMVGSVKETIMKLGGTV